MPHMINNEPSRLEAPFFVAITCRAPSRLRLVACSLTRFASIAPLIWRRARAKRARAVPGLPAPDICERYVRGGPCFPMAGRIFSDGLSAGRGGHGVPFFFFPPSPGLSSLSRASFWLWDPPSPGFPALQDFRVHRRCTDWTKIRIFVFTVGAQTGPKFAFSCSS